MAGSNPNQEHYSYQGAGEYIVRHGEAAPIREPKALSYAGRLDTPQRFLDKKREATNDDDTPYYKPQDATFVVDQQNNTVTLYANEWMTPADTVTGKLEINPILTEFGINVDGKTYSPKALWMFLKPRGYYFNNQEEYHAFLAALSNFNVSVLRTTEQRHDNAGNKRDLFERVIKENSLSNNPRFTLKLPLFKGYEAKTFTVELGFDPTDAGVAIFLFSDELHALLLEERDALFAPEIAYFTEWGCSVITKS